MKTVSLCALLSFLSIPATQALGADARPAKPEMKMNIPPYDINSQVFDFPTGLRVVMQSDRSHPVVTVYTIVNHGASDDPVGKEENAHFCEHAWFRSRHGTLPTIMELFNEIGDIGVTVNASTRNDFTDFSTVASSEYLELLLRLESLRLTEPYAGITESEVDTEREVIRNEFRWRREKLEYFKYDYVMDAVYPEDHAYHHSSSHASIDNIRLADIKNFMDSYYTPENTTITIVGDFDPAEASSLIFKNIAPQLLKKNLTSKNFVYSPKPGVVNPDQNELDRDFLVGAYDPDSDPAHPLPFPLQKRETPRVSESRPPVPDPPSKDVVYKKGEIDNRKVIIAWSMPGGYRSDHWDLIYVGFLLNQYIGRGLQDELRDERVRNLGCGTLTEVVSSTMMCEMEIMDDKIDALQVRDRMVDQISELWNPDNYATDTPQAKYFNNTITRAKMEIVADQLLQVDVYASPYQGRALEIGESAHLMNEFKPQSAGIDQVMAIDVGKIKDLASTYLTRARVVTVVVEPESADNLDVASERSTYTGHESEGETPFNAAIDLSKVGPEQIADSYLKPSLETMQDFELPNQMRVVVVKHGTAPVVQASLLFHRDFTTEDRLLLPFVQRFTSGNPNDPLQVAGEVNWLYDPGVPGMTDYPALARPMYVQPGDLYGNMLRWQVRVPSGNLQAGLWMLRDEVESAKPYVDAKQRFIDDQKDNLEQSWGTSRWALANAQSSFLYPNTPWSNQVTWDQVQQVSDWGASTVQTYLSSMIQPANTTLVIVGNIEIEDAKKLALEQFGGWTNPAATKPPARKLSPPPMPTASSKILIFDQPNATQTGYSMTCRLNVTDPQKQRTAVSVLGSLLGQDTFATMRVKEGLAYSPGATASVGSDGSATLTFYADAINSGIGRMIEYSRDSIKNVEAGGIGDDQLKLEKLRDARIEGLFSQSITQVTEELTDTIRFGRGWDTLTDHGDEIAGVTADDLKALMQGCGEHAITTLQGPKDILIPELEEHGYQYEVANWRAEGDDSLWKYDPKQAKKNVKDKAKSDKKKAKDDAKKKDAPAGS